MRRHSDQRREPVILAILATIVLSISAECLASCILGGREGLFSPGTMSAVAAGMLFLVGGAVFFWAYTCAETRKMQYQAKLQSLEREFVWQMVDVHTSIEVAQARYVDQGDLEFGISEADVRSWKDARSVVIPPQLLERLKQEAFSGQAFYQRRVSWLAVTGLVFTLLGLVAVIAPQLHALGWDAMPNTVGARASDSAGRTAGADPLPIERRRSWPTTSTSVPIAGQPIPEQNVLPEDTNDADESSRGPRSDSNGPLATDGGTRATQVQNGE